MSTLSGACMVSKVSGMLQIRDDTAPPMLEWKAIDQSKSVSLPLTSLTNLKASKEDQPTMKLLLLYKDSSQAEQKLMLTFNNRPTMNSIKEALQMIVARSKTVIKDSTPTDKNSASVTPSPMIPKDSAPASSASYVFADSDSLSDENLLKNHQLQQKYLLEDKNLRDIFTQSVIRYKMSPSVFWGSRLNQLRTYALTISQHRGPYNVLSTIKPVATSDNQVNVNVTRDAINDIFSTYPQVNKAYHDLVPSKISEGEFWSRFFNSKLFRRLRGDKINNTNDRGDFILDKYLYVDHGYSESSDHKNKKQKTQPPAKVSTFLDLLGNEDDNSQKLGNAPDYTMKYSDMPNKELAPQNPNVRAPSAEAEQENEMIILMRNMNELSSKMINWGEEEGIHLTKNDSLSKDELKEYDELELHDLNVVEDNGYVELHINTISTQNKIQNHNPEVTKSILSDLMSQNKFGGSTGLIDLKDTYTSRNKEIDHAYNEVTGLVRQNYRAVKLINNTAKENGDKKLIEDNTFDELITFNMTAMEFLSQFWKLFLSGRNPVQLKKIFASLRNCCTTLTKIQKSIIETISSNERVMSSPKLQERLLKDLINCIRPVQASLDKACSEFVQAVTQTNSSIDASTLTKS